MNTERVTVVVYETVTRVAASEPSESLQSTHVICQFATDGGLRLRCRKLKTRTPLRSPTSTALPHSELFDVAAYD